MEKELKWKHWKKTIWQNFEIVQKVHFIENGGFDPKDINWLDSIIGNMHRKRPLHDFNNIFDRKRLEFLAVVVVESSKGVVRQGQYTQVRPPGIHFKFTYLNKSNIYIMWNFKLIKIVRISKKKRWTDQVVKVHPLKEGWVKILQVLIHCLTLDLLRKQTISCFSFEAAVAPGAVAPHFDFGRSPFPLPSVVETQDREIHETGKKHVSVKREITMKICFGDWRTLVLVK